MIYLLPISHTPAIDSQLNTLKRSSENRSTDPYCLKAYFLKMSHISPVKKSWCCRKSIIS